jgi:predicted PurR-regulated permease PerM
MDESNPPPQPGLAPAARSTPVQIVLVALGAIAFLYFARPVVLPVVLACIVGTALKPLMRWSASCRLPPALSAVAVLSLLLAATGVGFFQLGRPALQWMNEAPRHMTELRQRVQSQLPRFGRFTQAAAAVQNLGATEVEKKEAREKAPTVEVKESRGAGDMLDWTGTVLAGIGETAVLVYLLLASGDLFLQKLVGGLPTLRGKKRALEISREIQQNISTYLLSVSLINIAMGVLVSVGCFLLGVPNAAIWGMIVALLNFVPYFGPVAGVLLLAAMGTLTFDTIWRIVLPALWYLLLHLLEANFLTPIILGRRFTLNPVVIFVSFIFWTWLWGMPGALLSMPILVSLKVVCDHLPALAPVANLLAGADAER